MNTIMGTMEEEIKKAFTERKRDDLMDFAASVAISGFFAAIFKTINAPMDRIKVILQTQGSSKQVAMSGVTPYTGFLNALTRLPKEQGFLSLWRGNLTNLIRYFPSLSLNFAFFDIFYKSFSEILLPDTKFKSDALSFVSGGLAGACSCSMVYPLDFCATRLAADIGDGKRVQRQFFNLPDCLAKVYRSDGIRGYYQGFPSAVTGMFIYRSTYFGVYATGKGVFIGEHSYDPTSHKVNLPFLKSLAVAQCATMTAAVFAYPMDTVARRLMMQSGVGKEQFASVQSQFKKILQKEGLRGFYRGILTNLLRTFTGSFILVFYDYAKGYYERSMEKRRNTQRTKD